MNAVGGHRLRVVKVAMMLNVAMLAFRHVRGPARAMRALRSLAALLDTMGGGGATGRYVQAGRRCFSHLYAPGWPSRAFDDHMRTELAAAAEGVQNGATPLPGARLQTVIFAITRRCRLRCEHCSEWDRLNEPDRLSADDLGAIVAGFQSLGVVQIHFSGGDPLERYDDIVRVLRRARPGTDFWIFSSGVGLTQQRAEELRRAGLSGVNLSLDHWRPDGHDAFRGREGTFEWVARAARAVCDAGMALSLTLCPTREFVSEENLRRYVEVAAEFGAGFMQILEPRSVGRYAGRDVALGAVEKELLERFYLEQSGDADPARGPLVVYPAFDQRRVGCLGAGWRYAFVDADARLHPCPFCQRPGGSALAPDLCRQLSELRGLGCPASADAGLEAWQESTPVALDGVSRRASREHEEGPR